MLSLAILAFYSEMLLASNECILSNILHHNWIYNYKEDEGDGKYLSSFSFCLELI